MFGIHGESIIRRIKRVSDSSVKKRKMNDDDPKMELPPRHSFFRFGCNITRYEGPFRSNIPLFLQQYAHSTSQVVISPATFAKMWQLQFTTEPESQHHIHNSITITLNVLEEKVAEELPESNSDFEFSDPVHCDFCRHVGWKENPVCKKRYHFIIAGEGERVTGNLGISDDPNYLLHGVIHSNGYGHLLRLNGREGGSHFLSGFDIMSFWDRICIILCARKISVMDVSKKYGLDYRLLHTLQKGHTWYGNWGYQFARGSFGLTYRSYQESVQYLSKLSLTSILYDDTVSKYNPELKRTMMLYCSKSEKPLQTLQDLVCSMVKKSKHLATQYAVMEDLKMIYHNLFQPDLPRNTTGLGRQIVDAARKLLDSKLFIKEYDKEHPSLEYRKRSLRYWVMPEILNEEEQLRPPPAELLELPEDATVADLKKAAEKVFQDVYICFKRMIVKTIVELDSIKDSVGLKFVLGRENSVTVGVYCDAGIMSEFRTERGVNQWTLDCCCGTTDDDGEKMIECEKCQVWQHIRCVGISDTELPERFICLNCDDIHSTYHNHSLACEESSKFPSQHHFSSES